MNNYCKLLELLNELKKILRDEKAVDISNIYKQIVYLESIIIDANGTFSSELKLESKNILHSFFPPHGGLTDYFIWKNSFEDRKVANKKYNQIKSDLWNMIGEL